MKLAIVGCGLAVKNLHLPAIKRLLLDIKITALLSRTPASAYAVEEMLYDQNPHAFPPQVFGTLEDLLAKGEFDAVLLSLPTEHNLFYIEAFLSRNIPVICEKPIALNVEQGKQVIGLVEKYGNLLYIAENYRHLPELHKARELIYEEEAIGEPKVLIWNQWGCVSPTEGYGATEWRVHPKHVGGYLSDGGVHHVAAMRLLLGEITQVKGFGFQQLEHTGAVDTYSASIQFASGAIGSYAGTYALTDGGNLCMVRGTEGYITITSDKVYFSRGLAEGKPGEFWVVPSMGYYEEFLDFLNFVEGKDSGLGSPYEALEDLRVIEQLVGSL